MIDAQVLRDSFARASRSGSEVTRYFYSHLFLLAPEVRPMFPVVMDAQRDRLLAALGRIAAQAGEPEKLNPYLQQLGRDHRRFDVVVQHYEAVGQSLLATLAHFLGEDWTPELERQWAEAYMAVAQTMVEAAVSDEPHNPPWWQGEVVRHELRGADISVVTLRLSQPMRYEPGQSVMVELPLLPSTWRAYTPANAPRSDGTIDLHVRAVDGGLVSPAVVYGLQMGDVVRLGAPMGSRLTLGPSQGRDLVLVAGGTGLAPMRALVEQLAASGARRRVDLFVASRDTSGLYDLPALHALAPYCPWLTVRPLVGTDAGTEDDRSLAGPVLREGPWNERAFYICGSPSTTSATVRDLVRAGIPYELLHFEEER
ncbi:globin domain-containing protein [Streptomyces sp. NPDC093970]|uniref:globin domain-containing protein n=1 Tax=Streptomyces sp. NPDC093970 TaxID=3155076 RepID=UPI00343E364E